MVGISKQNCEGPLHKLTRAVNDKLTAKIYEHGLGQRIQIYASIVGQNSKIAYFGGYRESWHIRPQIDESSGQISYEFLDYRKDTSFMGRLVAHWKTSVWPKRKDNFISFRRKSDESIDAQADILLNRILKKICPLMQPEHADILLGKSEPVGGFHCTKS